MSQSALAMTGLLASELSDSARLGRFLFDTRSVRVRNSHLKAMGRSPAHCYHSMAHDFEPSLAMRIGSAVHSMILGGPDVIVFPGKVRRGKEWDAFESINADSIIVTAKEKIKAERMAESVRSHRLAAQLLYAPDTVYETTILWDQNGRARRCTPDAMSKSHLVDLKTCRIGQPGKFQWDAIRMGYHAQLSDYRSAMESQNGYAPRDVYIVSVESSEPYVTAVYEMTSGALEMGDRLCRGWLELLLACEESRSWPGYCDSAIKFEVPDLDLELSFDDSNDETEQ